MTIPHSALRTPHSSPFPRFTRRRAGKIALLPLPLREQINRMLQENLPYADIIARLGEPGKHLNKDNLSRWRKAQYQDWLWEQNWRDGAAARPAPPPAFKEMCRVTHDLEAAKIPQAISRDPARLVSFLNFLGKVSRPLTDPRENVPPASASFT